MNEWPKEKTERLIELRKSGKSSSYIADILGVSRSTVVGKLTRLGMIGDIAAYRRRQRQRDYERDRLAGRKAIKAHDCGSWDVKTFESYEHRKIRLAAERARERNVGA